MAADSRVTLMTVIQQQPNAPQMTLPATFDNATKLLKVKGQDHVGAVTYGVGAIGQKAPRTAHSFIPEFEANLSGRNQGKRLAVESFAQKVSEFFTAQWNTHMVGVAPQAGHDMAFLVGGYDEGSPYGRIFDFYIPSRPTPQEQYPGQGEFGIAYGGQREFADRILQRFDDSLPAAVAQQILNLSDQQRDSLRTDLRNRLTVPVPYAFLPLQDCVDLAIFLIRATIMMQGWWVGIRGVGGSIDVATITRTKGFVAVQEKTVAGER